MLNGWSSLRRLQSYLFTLSVLKKESSRDMKQPAQQLFLLRYGVKITSLLPKRDRGPVNLEYSGLSGLVAESKGLAKRH